MPWPGGATVVGMTTIHDEKNTIGRAIASYTPLCDSIIALDTGSTDGSVELAEYMGAEVVKHEWEGSSTANKVLLDMARDRGDYGLFFGATETVEQVEPLPELGAPLYVVPLRVDDLTLCEERLYDTSIDWQCDGPVHTQPRPHFWDERRNLPQLLITKHDDDGRRQGKLERYLANLEEWLVDHPHDSRSIYHLANTYYHLGKVDTACGLFKRRASMSQGDIESWHALYMAGVCEMRFDFLAGAHMLIDCIQQRPARMEPVFTLEQALLEVRKKTPLPDTEDLLAKGELLWINEDAYLGGVDE